MNEEFLQDAEREEAKQLMDFFLDLEEYADLKKRSIRKIILFALSSFLVWLVILLNQGNPLFIFDFANQNLNASETSRLFGLITYLFLLFTLGHFLYFTYLFYQQRHIQKEAVSEALPKLKKAFDAFDLFSIIPTFLLLLVFLNAVFFAPAVVDGQSMEPTFEHGDPVLIFHFTQRYQKDDIVIINMNNRLLIKRLIAKPGDTLKVTLSGIWVNGELIEEDVRANGAGYLFLYDGIVGENQYFVMGDNRGYTSASTAKSNDSRYFGFLTQDQLLGKVIIKFGF